MYCSHIPFYQALHYGHNFVNTSISHRNKKYSQAPKNGISGSNKENDPKNDKLNSNYFNNLHSKVIDVAIIRS